MDGIKINRTRNLTVFQLFEVLQEEYIICILRYKIYLISITNREGLKVSPKEYWHQTAEKKKEKILDISKKNSLLSIFDDKRIKQDFIKRIIPEFGYPNFSYQGSTQQLIQEKWDLHNYYTVNSEVKMLDENGKLLFGYIISIDFNKKIAVIQIKDSVISDFHFDIISRVLEI